MVLHSVYKPTHLLHYRGESQVNCIKYQNLRSHKIIIPTVRFPEADPYQRGISAVEPN